MYKDETIFNFSGDLTVYRPGWNTPAYVGKFCPTGHIVTTPRLNGIEDVDSRVALLTARGAEAWNRLRPDLPDFTLATSIYEMKDFIPLARDSLLRIIGQVAGVQNAKKAKGKKSELSKSGQFYLAAQFGYIPLLRDIQNYVKAQKGAQKRLDQLMRDAGKPVRRRTSLRDDSTPQIVGEVHKIGYDGEWGDNFLVPGLVTQCYRPNAGGGTTTTVDLVSATWAEGSFRYFLPPGPRNVVWKKGMLKRIMGHRITPRELYQVMPWSWLIDYFTSLGDLVSNLSSGVADKLICDYAYIMQTRTERLYTVSSTELVVSSDGTTGKLVEASMLSTRTSKIRVPASPFGWGLSQKDLSPSQVAILGALGLSRLP